MTARCSRARAALTLSIVLTVASCAEDPLERPVPGQSLDAGIDATTDSGEPSVPEAGATADASLPPSPVDAGPDAAESFVDAAALAPRELVVLPDRWTVVDASADPFSDRLDVVTCAPMSVMAELLSAERVLGIDTGGCNYVTVAQPTRREIAAGEVVKVRLWHFELTAPEPAEAHAALTIDGFEVLNERIPIPLAGGLIVKQVPIPRRVALGAPAYFHLHNHGANSWALVEVSAGP